MPSFVRRRRLPEPQLVNGTPETWSIDYLTDVILTRDPWMHRLDLARATGQAPVLTADHDSVIVADAVLEWARRHGQPYRLELTGPPAEAGAPVRAVRNHHGRRRLLPSRLRPPQPGRRPACRAARHPLPF